MQLVADAVQKKVDAAAKKAQSAQKKADAAQRKKEKEDRRAQQEVAAGSARPADKRPASEVEGEGGEGGRESETASERHSGGTLATRADPVLYQGESCIVGSHRPSHVYQENHSR